MQKFRDVLSRWERKELSAMEAGELLARSDNTGAIDSAMRRKGSKLRMRSCPVDRGPQDRRLWRSPRDPADGRKDIVLAARECDGHHKKAQGPVMQ